MDTLRHWNNITLIVITCMRMCTVSKWKNYTTGTFLFMFLQINSAYNNRNPKGQFHFCWCPGSLRCQAMTSGTMAMNCNGRAALSTAKGCVSESSCLPQGRVSTTRPFSVLRYKMKCKLNLGIEINQVRKGWIKSLWPSDAIWSHRDGSPLSQIMAWCTKLLPEPMLTYHQ